MTLLRMMMVPVLSAFAICAHEAPALSIEKTDPDASVASNSDRGGNGLGLEELLHGRAVDPRFIEINPETMPEFHDRAERKIALPPSLLQDGELASLAVRYSLRVPQSFDQGVYGKLGSSSVYLVPRNRIPFRSRLYWTMVKVLSEKYGCFIVSKRRQGDRFDFRCRDGRGVVMGQKFFRNVAQFWVRQFDRDGRELIIRRGDTGMKAFARMMHRRNAVRKKSLASQ